MDVYAMFCRDISEISCALLKTARYDFCSHFSFANSYIFRISSILAKEMDIEMFEKSLVILHHILMRSFDAAYRISRKFPHSQPSVCRSQEFCGRLCTFKVASFLYLILDKPWVRFCFIAPTFLRNILKHIS